MQHTRLPFRVPFFVLNTFRRHLRSTTEQTHDKMSSPCQIKDAMMNITE